MTLLELIRRMETVAAGQPAVNMVVRESVYKLNSCPAAKYGVFAWTEGQHRGNADNAFHTFAFTLFYVDRLTADKANGPEIHSVGVEVLGNVLRVLAEEVGVSEWRITPFSGQRFADECAGVYATVEITVPAGSACGEEYDNASERMPGAFDFSWSDDFQVWIWTTTEREIFVI